jgi:hypothetical protein
MTMRTSLTVLLCLILCLELIAQSGVITIDEDYSDWDSNYTTFTDGVDVSGGLDLLEVQVTNDEDYLFIKLTADSDFDLTDDLVDHELWMIIDADNDPSTGYFEQDGYGSELSLNFLDHSAWFNVPSTSVQVSYGDIGFVSAPTVTSNTFEIAIPRAIKPNGVHSLFSSDTIRILFDDRINDDQMPDDGEVFQYVFDDSPTDSLVPLNLAKLDSSDVRVTTYNLHLNSGWQGASNLLNVQTVIQALDADVYAFQESSGSSAALVKNFMNLWIPLSTSNGWYAKKQGDLITCSRWPFLEQWGLTRNLATLIDLPSSYPHDAIVFNAHLSCCANDDGRQEQVDELVEFLLDITSQSGIDTIPDSTGIIITGDMNFVGYAQQITTMLTGDIQNTSTYGSGGPLDWDSTALSDAVPLHADQRMSHTWRDRDGDGYPPGRLDFQVFSDAVLNLEQGFVLDTEAMSPSRLNEYDLDELDTYWASDHLPVTVDYSFIPVVGTTITQNDVPAPHIYPNPSSNSVRFMSSEMVTSALAMDLFGNLVRVLAVKENVIQLDNLAAGIYLLDVTAGSHRFFEKVIVIR